MISSLMRVVDIETNDLDKDKGNILSVGIIDILPKESKDKTNENQYDFGGSFVNDIIIVNKEILYFWKDEFETVGREDIHHLSLEFMRRHSEEFTENLYKLASKIQYGSLITYNGDYFDIPFIRAFLKKNNIYTWEGGMNYDMYKLVTPLYRKANNITGKHGKLVDVAKWLGYDNSYANKAHDALEDCEATLFLFKKLAKGEIPVTVQVANRNPLDNMKSVFGV